MTTTLLLVDDSELIQSSLLRLLEGIPGIAHIATALTLEQALASVRRAPPALVILGLRTPDGCACPAITTLKQLAPEAQIAVLTNDASALRRKRCVGAGADWFFDKSTEFNQLLDVVRQLGAERSSLATTR